MNPLPHSKPAPATNRHEPRCGGRFCLLPSAFCLVFLAFPCSADLSRDTVETIKAATVYIETLNTAKDGLEDKSTGSGFVCDPKGLVLTNQHLVDNRIEVTPNRYVQADSQQIMVYFHRGTALEHSVRATLVRTNRTADLALLSLPPGQYASVPLGDASSIFETQTVYGAGHPLGLKEISIRTGSITAKRTFDGLPYLEHSVNVEQGNSGGPIFDDRGQVVGLVCFTLSSAEQNTNFAIPASTLQGFLEGQLPEVLRDSGGTGADVAYLQAMLDRMGLTYSLEGDGVFRLPYEDRQAGVSLDLWVSATSEWVLLQAYLGKCEAQTEKERLALYEALLRANFKWYIGKFGLDEDGDLWVEHHLSRKDLTSEALAEYAGSLAKLGIKYLSGEIASEDRSQKDE